MLCPFLEALVGKTLWKPDEQLWVELLVLEALIGKNTLESLNNLDRDQSMMVVIFDHEVESLV